MNRQETTPWYTKSEAIRVVNNFPKQTPERALAIKMMVKKGYVASRTTIYDQVREAHQVAMRQKLKEQKREEYKCMQLKCPQGYELVDINASVLVKE